MNFPKRRRRSCPARSRHSDRNDGSDFFAVPSLQQFACSCRGTPFRTPLHRRAAGMFGSPGLAAVLVSNKF
jgi:hypothetical protein